MRKSAFLTPVFSVIGLVTLVVVAGCSRSTESSPTERSPQLTLPTAAEGTNGEHGHKPGHHGGVIVEIGRDNYHAEAIFAMDGVVRVYTLGQDEARVEDVESQTLTAYARRVSGGEAVQFQLEPIPQPGDARDRTSLFVGTLPRQLWGQRVEVTVPSIRIAGARYRFAFTSPEADSHADATMPNKVASDDERKLYLTPGGKYTEADIKANGYTTASQKFMGLKPAHDAEPKSGDKLCPISRTKASSKFTWVVGGKTYEFCCPPCVDEFLQKAKETPEQVKDPSEYIQRP